MTMGKAVLEARDLRCGYVSPVVRGVSIDVRGGELVVLMGPNGAGKSTLIRCILGMARVFKGSIRVDGRDVSRMSRREVASSSHTCRRTTPLHTQSGLSTWSCWVGCRTWGLGRVSSMLRLPSMR
uniref:ATP-binding cassette domain-containing protein n=1 Tax=Vulcanisaeta sp. JCM 14467 TaxID=1295370 RepID=UPI00318306E1